MIDLKDLRDNPDRYRGGAKAKGADPHVIDRLLDVDQQLRAATAEREQLTAEKNRIGKQIGQIAGQLKKVEGEKKQQLQDEMAALQRRPNEIKQQEQALNDRIAELEPKRQSLLLDVPMPPDPHVPLGESAADNVEIKRWNPDWFDPAKSFKDNKGFAPKSHIEIGKALGLFDLERGVKMAGSRSYVLSGMGMLLHQAVLRLAYDFMIHENGFTALSVPVMVREQMMFGTAFFPHAKDQCYEIKESERGGGHDLYLTGTGEVGLMGFHEGEIFDAESLPRCYTTVSTCFRREAGAAGKDTAGLYRIHQFDKVEQVVICRADSEESRAWHQKMIGFVETLMQRLEIPYRLLQCCTADIGHAKADMVDIESWMPSRGEQGPDGLPTGAWGETHSASKLYDYQTRRLNIRYKDPDTGKNVICHSLNNTVIASPRILIPILELYQNEDGSVTVPPVLRSYVNGVDRIA